MQFVEDGEERIVVGSLDLNQCLWLPDELTGKRPGVSFQQSEGLLDTTEILE